MTQNRMSKMLSNFSVEWEDDVKCNANTALHQKSGSESGRILGTG